MKIRSKPLLVYLANAGVLGASTEKVAACKRQYRQEYKRAWKAKNRPKKELRITVTLREYENLKAQAMTCNTRPTPYARNAILAAVISKQYQVDRRYFANGLQLLGMAINRLKTGERSNHLWLENLIQAENVFLEIWQQLNY